MATHSYIGIEKENHLIDAIYCHWGGLTHLQTLQEHFRDKEKATQLIAGGSISVLGAEISGADGLSVNTPIKGQTIFYHRDGGEVLVVERDMSREEFMNLSNGYLYSEGKWTFYKDED